MERIVVVVVVLCLLCFDEGSSKINFLILKRSLRKPKAFFLKTSKRVNNFIYLAYLNFFSPPFFAKIDRNVNLDIFLVADKIMEARDCAKMNSTHNIAGA